MKSYLKTTYGVEYKSGIYDLLERLNLSHQKAHFDYSNADPEKQKAFVAQPPAYNVSCCKCILSKVFSWYLTK